MSLGKRARMGQQAHHNQKRQAVEQIHELLEAIGTYRPFRQPLPNLVGVRNPDQAIIAFTKQLLQDSEWWSIAPPTLKLTPKLVESLVRKTARSARGRTSATMLANLRNTLTTQGLHTDVTKKCLNDWVCLHEGKPSGDTP